MPFDGTVYEEINQKIALIDKIDGVLSDESKWCKFAQIDRGRMCLLGAINAAITGSTHFTGGEYHGHWWVIESFAEVIDKRSEPPTLSDANHSDWRIAYWNNGDETTFAHIKEVIAQVRENIKTQARVAA